MTVATSVRLGVAAVVVAACVWAARVDVPALTGGIKGDEATYVAMALSVARDGDLKYEREDFVRFEQAMRSGPNGIFLKQGRRPDDQALEFGKPFAYSVAASPLVAVFGVNGLLLFNILLLAIAALAATAFCRARLGPVGGALVGLGFVGASIVPVYAAWMTPEIFNFTLVLVAYFLWLYKKVAPGSRLAHPATDWVAALLLGVATFSKPSNALLIAPLILDALYRARWAKSAVLAGLFVAGSAGLFGVNKAITGDWNYQGGVRSAFSGPTYFPFDDHGTTFSAGNAMSTNEANDENVFSPAVIERLLPRNAWYFLVGRDAGMFPYYFPGALILLWFLVRSRAAEFWQWMTLLAWAGSCVVLLLVAPASWNGGGGPIGNRYFISLYPALLFLTPAAVRSLIPSLGAIAVGLACVGPILAHPFTASRTVWLNPERWPLRLLPIELTMMEDLPVRLNIKRARVEVCKDPQVFLYYLDSHTYYQEADGFWVAPGATDIVVRTEFPLSRLDLKVHSPIANTIEMSIGGRSQALTLRPNEEQTIQLHPDPGVYARASYQVVWHIETAAGFFPHDFDPASQDARRLAVFISPKYAVSVPGR